MISKNKNKKVLVMEKKKKMAKKKNGGVIEKKKLFCFCFVCVAFQDFILELSTIEEGTRRCKNTLEVE